MTMKSESAAGWRPMATVRFPTIGDVARWVERRDQIERMMSSLKVEWAALERKLKVASVFVDLGTFELRDIPPPSVKEPP